jgi:hypothetical protein
VDTVAPVVQVTTAIAEVSLADYLSPGVTAAPVLSGTYSDGGGVGEIYVRVQGTSGTVYWSTAERDATTWRFRPWLTAPGPYIITIEAWDLAGNVSSYGPFGLWVTDMDRIYLPLVFRNH